MNSTRTVTEVQKQSIQAQIDKVVDEHNKRKQEHVKNIFMRQSIEDLFGETSEPQTPPKKTPQIIPKENPIPEKKKDLPEQNQLTAFEQFKLNNPIKAAPKRKEDTPKVKQDQ